MTCPTTIFIYIQAFMGDYSIVGEDANRESDSIFEKVFKLLQPAIGGGGLWGIGTAAADDDDDEEGSEEEEEEEDIVEEEQEESALHPGTRFGEVETLQQQGEEEVKEDEGHFATTGNSTLIPNHIPPSGTAINGDVHNNNDDIANSHGHHLPSTRRSRAAGARKGKSSSKRRGKSKRTYFPSMMTMMNGHHPTILPSWKLACVLRERYVCV